MNSPFSFCMMTLMRLRSLVNSSGQDQDFASVRLVVVGGEEARSVDIDAFREHFAENAQFINGLGMTESTTALQWRTGTRGEYLDARVPIGKPVSHTEVELVNADGEPADVFGEIVILEDAPCGASHRVPIPFVHRSDQDSSAAHRDGGNRKHQSSDST